MIKRFIPFAHAKSVFDIEVSFYKKLGIKYLFVDLDNTLDSYKTETPSPKVLSLKESLKKCGIEMIVVSNNTGKRVSTYANALGVKFIPHIGKPFASGLNKALKELKIGKDEVLVIGDQTVTDISAANGAKMKNVLTDKIVEEDQPTTRFNRLFDRPIRKSLAKKGLLKDWREF